MRALRTRATRIAGNARGGARARFAAALLGISVILLAPSGAAAQEGAVERLHRFFDETRNLSAAFRQRVLDEEGRLVEESTGRVSLARPGRFRWVYREPFEQQIVGDGSQIWIYDADLDQVTVSEAAASIGAMPAMLLYSDRPIEDSFEVRALDAREGLLWAELLPRGEDSGFMALRIGLGADGMRVLELDDSFDQLIRIDFVELETDVDFSEGHFLFVPPEGADVFHRY